MIRGEFDATGAADPAELRAEYEAVLADVVERLGVETVTERSGLPAASVESISTGDAPDLSIREAAAVLAADDDRPDTTAIAAEAHDILLLGMTTAVVDVDTLASTMNGALEPKELQQKVEGRQPMTLSEYAQIHHELGEHAE